MIINTKSLEEARRLIDMAYAKKDKVIVIGQNAEFNRKILENNKVFMLLAPEQGIKKDRLKERDSGLNHILCQIGKKNRITFGIDFAGILNKNGKERANYLARIMQNISLYKKAKNNVSILNTHGRKEHDLFSLLLVLGMPTDMAKNTVNKTL